MTSEAADVLFGSFWFFLVLFEGHELCLREFVKLSSKAKSGSQRNG